MSDKTMDLPEGITCADCMHTRRCVSIFGVKETNTSCDFYPIRFQKRLRVHFLNGGYTPCELDGPPNDWPPGNVWSGDWSEITCKDCLKVKPDE